MNITTTNYSNYYGYYPIALEYPFSGYSSKAKANPGESFISPDGNNWTDTTMYIPNTNVCIKAFTDPLRGFYADFFPTIPINPPLSVQFIDLSKNATSWSWDFGDGSTSTQQNPEHNYTAAGKYNVTLTASDGNNTDSKSAQITVPEEQVAIPEKTVLPVANEKFTVEVKPPEGATLAFSRTLPPSITAGEYYTVY